MVSELVELRGHIIDSLLLPKVLDEIIGRSGRLTLEELQGGRHRAEPSHARIRFEADDDACLAEILTRIGPHGAVPINHGDARLEPAPADGVFPDGFYVTSNLPTSVRHDDRWIPVAPARMDCGVRVDPSAAA